MHTKSIFSKKERGIFIKVIGFMRPQDAMMKPILLSFLILTGCGPSTKQNMFCFSCHLMAPLPEPPIPTAPGPLLGSILGGLVGGSVGFTVGFTAGIVATARVGGALGGVVGGVAGGVVGGGLGIVTGAYAFAMRVVASVASPTPRLV